MPTALITGASRGIGRRTAERLAAKGWNLLLVSRSGEQLEELATQCRAQGVEVSCQSLDLTDASSIAAGVAELLQQGQAPSVLINNAGAAYTGDLLAMPLERWQWLLQLNLTSVMQVCAAAVPAMRDNGGGLVINISSHAARNAFPQWGAYCVTKAALASFTRCLAEEERSHGIRACTLTLGGCCEYSALGCGNRTKRFRSSCHALRRSGGRCTGEPGGTTHQPGDRRPNPYAGRRRLLNEQS